MSLLRPFRGLRPPAPLAPRLAAPPYDVVSTEEARALSRGNPQSFFHLSRPEVGLPPGTDEHADAVYARGQERLAHFVAEGWLVRDAAPCFYAYRQRMGSHVQVGLVAAASVAAYDAGTIRKHEHTRPDKEDDRTRHIDALGANDEPVFLTYRARGDIDAVMDAVVSGPPVYDFVAGDGVAHTFWVVGAEHTRLLEGLFAQVPRLYIADGHHRSAAASRVHALRRARGEAGNHDAFLAVVFPDSQMQILPYHRLVRELGGLTPEAFLSRLSERFEVTPARQAQPTEPRHLGLFLSGRWWRLVERAPQQATTPLQALDVSLLQEAVLGPLLGITDPRRDARLSFVGGIRGTGELEAQVASGRWQAAFALFPTRLSQLMAIADAGDVMPPKSTWFEPKLRSGLVLHPFD